MQWASINTDLLSCMWTLDILWQFQTFDATTEILRDKSSTRQKVLLLLLLLVLSLSLPQGLISYCIAVTEIRGISYLVNLLTITKGLRVCYLCDIYILYTQIVRIFEFIESAHTLKFTWHVEYLLIVLFFIDIHTDWL